MADDTLDRLLAAPLGGPVETLDPLAIGTTLPETHNLKYLENSARELAALKMSVAASRGEDADLREVYGASFEELSRDPNHEAVFNAHQAALTAEQSKATFENTSRNMAGRPELAIPQLEDFATLSATYQGPQGRPKLLVDMSTATLEESLQRSREVEGGMYNILKEKGKNDTFFDDLSNFGGLLIPGDPTIDTRDFIISLGDDSIMGSFPAFRKFVGNFQSLSPDAQELMLPGILDKMHEAYDGNTFKTAMMASMLFNPDYVRELNILETLDAVDIATLGLTMAGIFNRVRKSVWAAHSMAKLGLKRETAAIVAKAGVAKDPESIGMPLVDIADSVNPHQASVINLGKVDDISSEMQDAIPLIRGSADDVDNAVTAVLDDVIEQEAFRIDEKASIVANFTEALTARATKAGHNIENATLAAQDKAGFTMTYKLDGIDQTVTHKWTVDEIGRWGSETDVTGAFRNFLGKLTSPDVLLKRLDEDIVADLTFAGQQSQKARNNLIQIVKDTDKGLSKGQRADVDSVLVQGDVDAVEYTLTELLTGVQTGKGMKQLTVNEIKSYYDKRAFLNRMFLLKNNLVRRRLEIDGQVELAFRRSIVGKKKDGTPIKKIQERKILGRPQSTFGQLQAMPIGERIFAPQLAGGNTTHIARGALTAKKLTELEDEGYKLYRLYEPHNINVSGKRTPVQWAMMIDGGAEGIIKRNPLPPRVLQPATGYLPRQRKAGLWYVRDSSSSVNKTVAVFNTRAEAEAWRATQKRPDRFVPIQDKDFDAITENIESLHTISGLYTRRHRAKRPLQTGMGGEASVRMASELAIQRYIQNMTEIMPTNEYRVAIFKRFNNTVNHIVRQEKLREATYDIFKGVGLGIPIGDPKTRKLMEQTRDYLLNQFRMTTPEQRSLNLMMTDVSNKISGLGPVATMTRDALRRVALSRPMMALKGIAFHSYLGWFNPRQLYVQAQNASIALALDPINAGKAMPSALAMQAAFFATGKTGREALLQAGRMAKMSGDELAGLTANMEQFRKSGLYDAIVRTADYDANAVGIGNNGMQVVRNAAKKGLVMYEQGELFARLVSWNTARNRWLKANPGKKIGDADVADISKDSMRFHMNLQRENAAWWQNNAFTGLGTQFLQVQSKFIENFTLGIMGKGGKRGWTRAEASRALVGQIALYGVVGVPVAESVANYLVDSVGLTPIQLAEQYPNLYESINEGYMGFVGQLFGLDNNVSQAGSIIGGIDDNLVWDIGEAIVDMALYQGFTREEQGVDILLGAAGKLGPRARDSLTAMWAAGNDLFGLTQLKDSGAVIANVADGLGSLTSTWSNGRKAYMLAAYGEIHTAAGAPRLVGVESNWQTVLAKAMGFPLDEEVALIALGKYNRLSAAEVNVTVNTLIQALDDFRIDRNLDKLTARKAWVLADYTEGEQQELERKMLRKIQSNTKDRTLGTFITQYLRFGGKRLPLTIGDVKNGQ